MAPLTPRSAAKALRDGERHVSVGLKVDPVSVAHGGKLRGGDGGLSLLIAALNDVPTPPGGEAVTLQVEANMKPHHIQALAEGAAQRDTPLRLRLLLRDNDVLGWDAAGRPPRWKELLGHPGLQVAELDVAGCPVEDSPPPTCYMDHLAGCTALQALCLRHIGNELEGGADRAAFSDGVVEVLDAAKSLERLDLTHCDLGVHEGLLAAIASRQRPSVRQLRVAWNDMGGNTASLVAAFPSAEVLHLGRNDIGPEGAERLAAALPAEGLTELELNDNGLGSAGCAAVVRRLQGGCGAALRHLGLHGNGGGDGVAEAAAGLLQACPGLEVLDLSANGVTPAGLRRIAAVLPHPALRELNLSDNPIGAVPELLDLVLAAPSLRVNYFEAVGEEVRGALSALQASGCTPPDPAADAGALGPVVVGGSLHRTVAEVAQEHQEAALQQVVARHADVAAALQAGTLQAGDAGLAGVLQGLRAGGGQKPAEEPAGVGAVGRSLVVGPRTTVEDVIRGFGDSAELRLVSSTDPMSPAQLCLLAGDARLSLRSLATERLRRKRSVVVAVVGK